MDVRKPTQNSQQPRQTNPKARGVIQTKADNKNLDISRNLIGHCNINRDGKIQTLYLGLKLR
ncbi:hypothetical protein EYF80_061935 [Liparis tanakae]|uniref:Uncharacterized protein n=1 Tax=Liparis tanakae TaxID=230148 RepID=A0A4Z2EGM0_9TELE|nr:hypothetical protein EYF80_061935 [Liparis tanakae]